MLAFPAPSASPHYRPDIDGLRAFAVLSVIAYHIGVPGLHGGFVGVDVFFVLSGFLISGLLRQELLTTGRIGFTAFFARRIRRLAPALMLVTLATLLAGYVILLPDAANSLGREARAVVTLSANHHFLKHAFDYFNSATDLKPLLHTWSLAVEEQYYLLWPLMMVAAYRLGGSKALRPSLIGVLLLSLAACLWWSYHDMPLAFYLMPTRAWEFAAGGLLAWLPWQRDPARSGLALWLGLGGCILLLGSVLVFDEKNMVFPGLGALVPVAGTLLVLAAGALAPGNRVSRLLSAPSVTAIGLLSYSWYLWHQPLLALGRVYGVGERDLLRDLLLGGALSLLLAWLTYCLVEQPVRQRRPGWFASDRRTLWAGAMLSLLVWLAATAAMYLPKKYPWPGYQAILAVKQDNVALSAACGMAEAGVPLSPRADCRVGPAAAPLRLLAWGDSHTDHMMASYLGLAQSRGVGLLRRVYHGCPPLPDAVPIGEGKVRQWCVSHARAVLDEVRELAPQGLHGVLMSVRWQAYTAASMPGSSGMTALAAVDAAGKPVVSAALPVGSGALDRQHALQQLQASLDALVQTLAGQGLRLVLLAPVPEMPLSVPECVARRGAAACNMPRAEAERQRAPVMAILQQLAGRYPATVRVWDPLPRFCDATTCYASTAAGVRYKDQNHLTATMARSLQPDFAPLFDWASQR